MWKYGILVLVLALAGGGTQNAPSRAETTIVQVQPQKQAAMIQTMIKEPRQAYSGS